MLIKGRVQKGYIHATSDEVFYSNDNYAKYESELHVSMAGTTQADPDYFVNRFMIFDEQDQFENSERKYLYVLEYVISGKGHIDCEGYTYDVQAGDFYLLNPGTPPYYYADREDPFVKIWVNLGGRFLNALSSTYRITEPVLVIHEPSMETYIREIHQELQKDPTEETRESRNNIMKILLELYQKIDELRWRSDMSPQTPTFHQITEFINENIQYKQLDVDYIISHFYMSYSTFYRICMKNMALSPKHYIMKLKTDYAKMLLHKMKFSITRTADFLNFSSTLYFGKVFKKYTGMTPSEWKKSQKKET